MAVYLIQGTDGGPVKIGKADNSESRLKKIQRFSPVELRLLAAAVGGRRLEAKLHRRFKKHRLWGEWFNLPAEKLAELKAWMDERPDWQWAIRNLGREIKDLVNDMLADLREDKSLPKKNRDRLIEQIRGLREAVTWLPFIEHRNLPSSLAEIRRRATLVLGKVKANRFPESLRQRFNVSLRLLRELAENLRLLVEQQLPAHILCPVPPPSVPVMVGRPITQR